MEQEVRKAHIISGETLNKVIAFLGRCPYQEVAHFIGQFIAEAQATAHDIEEIKHVAEEIVSAVEEA